VVEIHPADWPEKFGQSTRRSNRVILSPSYTKWFSSSINLLAWPLQQEDSREELQNKKEIANRNMETKNRSNTLPSIFLAGLSKVYHKVV